MPSFPRLSLRLRRRALYCYEAALCASLLAMAFAAFEAAGQVAAAETVQCGNTRSSSTVTTR